MLQFAVVDFAAGFRAPLQVWVVDVSPEEAKKRLMARNNFSEEVLFAARAFGAVAISWR